jgi:hypothetical protein
MTPYKSKFKESKRLVEAYDLDAFNAFLEKEVEGFGGGGPVDQAKANAYYRLLIKTLEGYLEDDHSEKFNPIQTVKDLTKELEETGLDSNSAHEIAMDFVSGDNRREEAYFKASDEAQNVLEKYEHDLKYDSIFPGT